MRAKIIADIAVVVGYMAFFEWWIVNLFASLNPPAEPTVSQRLALVLAGVAMTGLMSICLVYTIQWIHKGK